MYGDITKIVHKNITEIINGKKKLHNLSQEILNLLDRFNNFFSIIASVAKKFDIVNLLTAPGFPDNAIRIEKDETGLTFLVTVKK